MLILQKQQHQDGSFYIQKDNNQVAEITYTLSDKKTLTIDHTEVDEALQGKNIGFQLVEHVVEFAREQHYKVVPKCSFARSVIEKNSQFADVLG